MPGDVRIGGIYADVKTRNAQFLSGMRKNGEALRRQQRAVKALRRDINNFNRSAAIMARRIGLVAGVAAGFAIKSFAEFGETMAKVRGISGATGEQFELLKSQAEQLGRTTRFSARQAAEGQLFLAQAGFEVNEIITALPGTLRLAQAATIDLGEAADIVSNVLSAFGAEAEETARFGDILTAAITSANTDLRQLAEGLKLAAPVTHAFGITVETTSAAIGVLSNAGLQASIAGTGLRRVVGDLANPTGDFVNVLKELGLQASEVSVEQLGLADALQVLNDAQISATQSLRAFGKIGTPAFLNLVNNIDTIRTLEDAFARAAGITARLAKLQDDTLAGAFIRVKSAADGFGLKLLDVSGAGNALNDNMNALANTINALTDGLADNINRIVHIAQVLGLLFIARTGFVRGIFRAAKNVALLGTGLTAAARATAVLRGAFFALSRAFAPFLIIEALIQIGTFVYKLGDVLEESKITWRNFAIDIGKILLDEFNKSFVNLYELIGNVPGLRGISQQAIYEIQGLHFEQTGRDISGGRLLTEYQTRQNALIDELRERYGRLNEKLAATLAQDDNARNRHNAQQIRNQIKETQAQWEQAILDLHANTKRFTDATAATASSTLGASLAALQTAYDDWLAGVAELYTGIGEGAVVDPELDKLRAELAAVKKEIEEAAAAVEAQGEVAADTAVNINELGNAYSNLGNSANENLERLTDGQYALRNIANETGRAFGGFFNSLVRGFDSASDAAKAFGAAIIESVLNNLIAIPLGNALSTAIQGFFTPAFQPGTGNYNDPNLGIGYAAEGGYRRGLTLVGEQGPELVDFRNPARVYPNEDLAAAIGGGSGGTSQVFNFNISSTDGPGVRRALAETLPAFQEAARSAVVSDLSRPSRARQVTRGR